MKLKPCPFCGGQGVRFALSYGYAVVCAACGVKTSEMISQKSATQLWNQRNEGKK